MARLVRDLMTSRVVSVRADDSVSAAIGKMTRFGFSALPVVSDSLILIGVISLLDVIRYREEHAEQGVEADERVPVEEIMNPEPVSTQATANVASVAQRLRSHGQLRVMPVVQGGRLVGIVTRSDLLRGAAKPSGLGRLFGSGDKEEDDALSTLVRPHRGAPSPPADTPLRDVMATEVVVVTALDPIALAARVMLRDRHTSLPVVEADGTLVGVISEADILADPFAGRSAHATVGSVMTRTPVGIDVDDTVGQARSLVADRGLRMVPVTEKGFLVGVLSRSDLI